VLYLLKSQQVKTVKQLAELIGRHRITVQGWLRTYREGGLEELLGEKLPGGRKSSIPPWAIAQLTAKLEESPTFSTYREIQAWLELELEIKVSYDVVYYLVHDKLKISLAKTRDK
jgi:transposase